MEIIWEKSLKIIKEKVTQQNFDTWIQPLKIHSIEGENIQLAVPNKFFRDWLSDNYQAVLRDAISAVTGFKPNIHFLIDGRVQAPLPAAAEKTAEPPQRRNSSSIPSNLNPQYSFERFVVGPSNQFAHAACVAVAEQPAKNYNPLFLYGGVG
ncbi:MAG: DnaA N-terminal domain-containing protein, partial [Syntrophales bacterium]|nr:DnaA N-terminal domain-containing protein [Syntrophales bacterium]